MHHEGRDVPPACCRRRPGWPPEEGQLGADWIRTLGAIPNEYLYYYYFTRDAIASITGARRPAVSSSSPSSGSSTPRSRAAPSAALREWDRVRMERNATYMREARNEGEERDEDDVQGGGYEGVALAIGHGRDLPRRAGVLILNVRNADRGPGLPADAVVEVPCTVDASGPRRSR